MYSIKFVKNDVKLKLNEKVYINSAWFTATGFGRVISITRVDNEEFYKIELPGGFIFPNVSNRALHTEYEINKYGNIECPHIGIFKLKEGTKNV